MYLLHWTHWLLWRQSALILRRYEKLQHFLDFKVTNCAVTGVVCVESQLSWCTAEQSDSDTIIVFTDFK